MTWTQHNPALMLIYWTYALSICWLAEHLSINCCDYQHRSHKMWSCLAIIK